MSKLDIVVFAATAAVLAMGGSAFAGVVGVSTEGGIAPDATIDWGDLGSTTTVVSNPFNTATSLAGLTANVSQSLESPFERRDQGIYWTGNFAPGEELLWTRGQNGPITFLFNQDVRGFGAQIQPSYGTFTATIEAFDAANNSLGSFTRTDGLSNGNEDDSAIFIGLLSDSLNVRKIVLSVPVNGGPEDFAINGPRIQLNVVPLPSSAAMGFFALSLAGAIGLRRRRQASL